MSDVTVVSLGGGVWVEFRHDRAVAVHLSSRRPDPHALKLAERLLAVSAADAEASDE